jgi:glycosyltransferase involved in cell wall biosynthesis
MRIAYISFIKDPWGGSEELWARSADEALSAGHEVIISAVKLNISSPQLEAFAQKGATVQYRRGFINPAWTRRERIARKILIFGKDRLSNPFRELLAAKPDIVVFSGAAYAMLLNRPLFEPLLKVGCPFLLNIQVNAEYGRPVNNEEAAWLRKLYQRSSCTVFVSQRNLDTAERHLLTRIPNTVVVRNPVNMPDHSLVPYPSLEQGIRIAIVANLLVNHKGQDLAFSLLRDAKWRDRNVTLHLYGSGHDEGYLRELAAFYGLGDIVHFHGRVSDIRSVWANAHLLLLPSLHEGMPLAVVEAMFCGRPVVTTDVGGNTEWIREGKEGFIAGGANLQAIDDALERAWKQRQDWERIGKAAHDRALALHDPKPGKTLFNLILKHGRRP